MKLRTWFCLTLLGVLLLSGVSPMPARAQAVLYVDWDATGANNGTSWPDAYTELQPALAAAGTGDQIWVAEGTYKPTEEHGGTGERYRSFQLKNDVALYGGFAGTESSLADRDWVSHATILSGDIGTGGVPSDNSYHVFYHPSGTNLDDTAVLDGFTISGGYADGTGLHDRGAGMYNDGSSPTLANCIFEANSANFGGGLANSSQSSPALTNCTFSGNSAVEHGGGMWNYDSSPTLTGCVFSGNSAVGDGGALYNWWYSSPDMTNCTFSGNTADMGGAMTNWSDSAPTLADCTFSGNSAYHGGGMYNSSSSPELTNCTFSDNSAGSTGGGMVNAQSSPTLTNCTFSGNSANLGGGVFNGASSSPTLANCIFSGNEALNRGGGVYNSSSGPILTDVTFSDNTAYDGGGMYNNGSSPVLTNCTFSGNEAQQAGGIYNYGSSPTLTDCTFSGNWAHSHGGGMYNDLSSPTLTNCTFSGNSVGSNGGGMYNINNSNPLIDGAVFQSNVANSGGGGVFNNGSGPQILRTTFRANRANWSGGGIYNISDSNPILDEVVFEANNGLLGDGGGMLNDNSHPTLTNCSFQDNRADTHNGGGMQNRNGSHPTLVNTTFSANWAQENGGGMANWEGSSPTLANATFSGNSADLNGGGMYNSGSSPEVTDCTFSGNSAGERGGGMSNWPDSSPSSPVVTNCTFSGNTAGIDGGGMYTTYSAAVVTNCSFSGNSATWGGGMYNDGSSPAVTNCTFSGNSAVSNGGGMFNQWNSSPAITNCILWGDTLPEIYNQYSSVPIVTYSDIQGGFAGTGNIDADPLFVDADGPDNVFGTDDDDLRLQFTSPAIDAGDNGAVPGGVTTDLEGNPRFVDVPTVGDTGAGTSPIVDMGAYEVQEAPPPPIIYVDAGATGANSGLSWADAFTDLQDALAWAMDGVEVWVAEGTYKPTLESSPGEPRTATFSLVTGVEVYGGFPAGGGTWEERDWSAHETFLSGDIGTEGNSSDNSYHVFYHPSGTNLDDTAVLDGFTVTGSNANGFSPHDRGGGMYNEGSSPTLVNVIFSGNTVWYDGGGMYNLSDSSPTLTNVTFSGNAANIGGGMHNYSSSPTLTDVTFYANTAQNGGGMGSTYSSRPTLTDVTFSANTASLDGGGMYNTNASRPTLTNCTFSGNSAVAGGGMYNDWYSVPVLTNCTFSGNSATTSGGGMYNSHYSSLELTDVTFISNTATDDGGGMYNLTSLNVGILPLTNVTFSGNTAAGNGGGMYNNGSSPLLANCTFSANTAGLDGGGMRNDGSSPSLTNCTFSGNSAETGGGVRNDGSSPTRMLTFTNVAFSGNDASIGGGMYNYDSSPTLTNCTFSGNTSEQGGGIFNDVGVVTLSDSTVSYNGGSGTLKGGGLLNLGTVYASGCTIGHNSAAEGGGIYNEEGALSLSNSTVSGNSADQDGGGIYDRSTASHGIKLFNVTLSGNVADADENEDGNGGGLAYYQGTVHVENSIIAGNDDLSASVSHPDCTATGGLGIPTTAYNLIGDETGCEGDFVGTGDQVGTAASPLDPLLGQLGDNGGSTQTHALQAESPARDAGDPAGCKDAGGALLAADQRGMGRPRDGGAGPLCDQGAFEAGPANDAWNRALELDISGGFATTQQYVDQLGQSRWFKFQVLPGSRITAELIPPDANLDIALFGDIQAAYDELLAPSGESDLVQLNAEFAADAFSPFAYSPFAYSPFAYSPFAYSPFAYSPFAYSPFAYSPFAYSPFAYSPFAYSPFAYSPFAYSPFAYSPFAYSPFAYSPFAYSPFAYSPDPAYSSAQMQSLMAISAFDGTAAELIEVNTWDNRGYLYLRVSGRNGAFDLSDPFTLRVTQDLGICVGVELVTRPEPVVATDGGYQTLFLTDWDRFADADPDELSALQVALDSFAVQYGGLVLDVGDDDYVQQANDVADAAPQCPYAKNQVAWLIKDIVTAYRKAGNPVEQLVLVGSDGVIPFFRYPDRAEIGSETDYKPPVLEGTSSYASLTLGYFLSQDAYGSTLDLALGYGTLPIPDLAVGRLVETPADILHMLETYALYDGSLMPATALVTGYDFLADAADAIAAELEAGLGPEGVVDTLISPQAISPADREGTPPQEAAWPSSMLDELLLGSRHDLVFLAGHFTAQGALAADYETRLWASELLEPTADLENALVYSAGCHSGYNVVNEHGVPYVTVEPDWAQAFAQAGATFVGGTGYQYGDTDFLEYSERLYLEFTRALRCGAQPQSVGRALVEAKQAYLAGTAQLRGIHEKAFLEATLFGLPMLQVSGLSGADCPVDPGSIVESTTTYTSDPQDPNDPATPGEILGLRYADAPVTSSLTQQAVPLRSVVEPDEYLDATYLAGTDGVVSSPAEPVLPLERRNVDVPGYVLRGVGFRGGRYVDVPGVVPLTGAASTETRSAHTPFQSEVPYPLQPWSVNYFSELAAPGSDMTWLDVTPAQFISDADDDLWTGTWRRFEDMEFRLFYSSHTDPVQGGAVPSLAAPPAVLRVLGISGADQVTFQVAVAGDLAAGVQEVWITYTGIACEGGTTCWRSLDLARNAQDSTLWEGTLALYAAPAGEIRYMVQAVNGVGLVTLVTNEGAYFQIDVDPADPSQPAEPAGGAEPPPPPQGTVVEFQSPPSSGTYSTEAEFSAVLRTADGTPLEGQRLTFALGAQQRTVVTDGAGGATTSFPLHGTPGNYTVRTTFAGSPGYERSSGTCPFTILKQETVLTFLEDPDTSQYSDDALLAAELTDVDDDALGEMTVLFVVSGGSYVVSEITDLVGQASPGRVPLPLGTHPIVAYFGEVVTVNNQTIDLRDLNYGGSHADGWLVVSPEDAAVNYTGETTVPEGSTTLNLAALVTQADDGAPGDITLAWVQFSIWDDYGGWIADLQAQVSGDGTVATTLPDLPPGSYQVGVTVVGDYFASAPAPQVVGVSLPPEPVALASAVSASATFFDPDSVLGHTAIWDWGDGTTCDTSVGGECALIEPSSSTAGEVNGTHPYALPGVYSVKLTVTDGDGFSTETPSEFVVIYDAEGGFVTGGGWIWSEAGWCELDELCGAAEGKANFGFVSRYKKGAAVPTGTTEFQFSAGGLNFHSDSYEWLLVNQTGTNAQYKGTGTINGDPYMNGNPYKFMIWAGDGDPDTFRIRIWVEVGDEEVDVYDNGFDQSIGGGSILIHQQQ